MFQSALRSKSVNIASEVANLSLEACVEEIKSKLALIERLEFACESFAALPDNAVTPLTVSLFASSFVDVDDKFVPEFSHKSLESSIATSGKEAKAFALESGEGVIARIWQFIKDLISTLADLISNLYYKIVGRNKKQAQEDKVIDNEIKETQKTPRKEKEEVFISMKSSFAFFVINGQFSLKTINKVLDDAFKLTKTAEDASKLIKVGMEANLNRFNQRNQEMKDVFNEGWELELIPKTDYPGSKKIVYRPSYGAFFEMVKEHESPPDPANVVSSINGLVIQQKDYDSIDRLSNLGTRDHLFFLFKNLETMTQDMKSQADKIFNDYSPPNRATMTQYEYNADYQNQRERLKNFKKALEIIPQFVSAVREILYYAKSLDDSVSDFKNSFIKAYSSQ